MIACDFETRSRCDLSEVGGRIYAQHSSTEAICAVLYDTETGDVGAWFPGMPVPVSLDDVLAAHNATGFDRFIAGRVWGAEFAHRNWVDTSELARRAGLPGALDALGRRWLGREKDDEGKRLTVSLSTCRRPSGKKNPDTISAPAWAAFTPEQKRSRGVQKEITPEIRRRVTQYCAIDVEIMAEGWPRLRPYLESGVFTGWEADVLACDRICNDRGIAFDRDLARALLEIDERAKEQAIDVAQAAVGPAYIVDEIIGSPAVFAKITGLPNAQKLTVENALKDPALPPHVRALCIARQAQATIADKKLPAGIARTQADGRMRDNHRYYGAHTGRDSGHGFQSQNMPRPEKEYEKWGAAEVDACVDRAMRREALTPGEIDVCLRATHTAAPGYTFVVSDFKGVEARATAWCAGDAPALDVFASGRDVYCVNATTIFPGLRYEDVSKVQRTAGKMAELACGYQGGPGAVDRIAKGQGVDLTAMGIDLQAIVDGWRALHPKIVRFWRDMNDAFLRAADGHHAKVACFDFVPSSDGPDVALFLPSGRPIVYGNVQVGRGLYGPEASYVGGWEPVWKCGKCGGTAPASLDAKPTDRSSWAHTVKDPVSGDHVPCSGVGVLVGREKLYGGLLTENAIQAMCRDLLFDALVRAEEDGLCPVLRVHDELVCEVPRNAGLEGQAELERIMTTLPEWAAGFPVGVSGHHGVRYRK